MMTRRSLMSMLALILPASLRTRAKASPVEPPRPDGFLMTWTHTQNVNWQNGIVTSANLDHGVYQFWLREGSLTWTRRP